MAAHSLKLTYMQAVLYHKFGGPEELHLATVSEPDIEPNEVLVEVHATALNRADTLQRRGHYPPPSGTSTILGLEAAGVIIKKGRSVKNWNRGDRVCALLAGGGYAERVAVPAGQLLPIPDGVSYIEAAAFPEVFTTAFQALHWIGKLKQKQRVLIHAGASGVGTAAIQLARLKEAEILVTASASKHDICRELGAQTLIDYRTENFADVVAERTDGEGVQIIVDFVAADYFQKNLRSLSVDGCLVLLALLGGTKPKDVNLATILAKRLRIQGSTLRNRTLDYKRRLIANLRETIWPNWATGTIKPVIDSTFDWSEVVFAHRRMEANENSGKIVLQVR